MRVRVIPFQPHCFAFGGFDLQMINALEASREAGVDVQRLDPWSRDNNFDILHIWGLEIAHGPAVHWARSAGKRVVMTALLPYPTMKTRLHHMMSNKIGAMRIKRTILDDIDHLVVVNAHQAKTAEQILRFKRECISVIPNIIDDQFFSGSTMATNLPEEGYILCTGNICPRKNQLALVHACREAAVPLLLVGAVLTGEDAYGHAVDKAISENSTMRWIRGMPPGSVELVNAYRGAIGFALVSHRETQPISLLEAAALGKPLLIADRPYAHQEFFANAMLVNPNSTASIARGLRELIDLPERYRPNIDVLKQCARGSVGRAYAETYSAVY